MLLRTDCRTKHCCSFFVKDLILFYIREALYILLILELGGIFFFAAHLSLSSLENCIIFYGECLICANGF